MKPPVLRYCQNETCGVPLRLNSRRDTRYCSGKCRVAVHRKKTGTERSTSSGSDQPARTTPPRKP